MSIDTGASQSNISQTHNPWIRFLDTSELLLLAITFLWGLQIVLYKEPYGIEPILGALKTFLPRIPTAVHGIILIAVSIIHFRAFTLDDCGARKHCILVQAVFFSYTWWSLVLAGLFIPGVFILPAYVAACAVNHLTLAKPMKK